MLWEAVVKMLRQNCVLQNRSMQVGSLIGACSTPKVAPVPMTKHAYDQAVRVVGLGHRANFPEAAISPRCADR